MKSLLTEEGFTDCTNRLNRIKASSQPAWGKMSAGQMATHCQKPLRIALGETDFGLKRNIIAQLFFKRLMYNDKAWPKGMSTPKAFKVEDFKDFEKEKTLLLDLIQRIYERRNKEHWPKHPVFGSFTRQQIGMMQYKHLDHHLRQFNV